MPGDWLYIDTNFPAFTGEESVDEKVTTIQNYLFMLVEQLRYTLHNLDGSNMNAAAAAQYAATLTDPIYARIEDEAGNLSQLAVTAQGIAARVSSAEGSISALTLTAEQLGLQLSNVQGNVTTLSATANGLATRVSNAEGSITTLTQTVNGFRLSASNGSTSSTLTLTSSGVAVSSATISFSGLVAFTDLSTRGATIINGANITTGLISANRLDLTGAITFSALSASVRNDINDAWSMADSAQDAAWEASDNVRALANGNYSGGTFIDGTSIYSPTIYTNELDIMPSYTGAGSFNLYGQYGSRLYHMLAIEYYAGTAPYIDIYSPASAYLTIGRSGGWVYLAGARIIFQGTVDFSQATVTGL